MDEGRPLFLQIAEQIENSIIDGSLAEEGQAPRPTSSPRSTGSTRRPRPRASTSSSTDGVLYKRRGIGMFVATGARALLLDRRREGSRGSSSTRC